MDNSFVQEEVTNDLNVAVADINADVFFKHPFNSLLRPKNLVEYTVMNIEPIPEHERRKFSGQGAISKKVSNI